MNNEAIEILQNILQNYGIDNPSEIIEEIKSSDISNNIDFEESPLRISADNWLKSRGFDIENSAGNYSHGIVFYPIKKDGKINKFHVYNTATQSGETRVLDRINSFDVSTTNYIEKSTGRASVDSFSLSERKYGYSINSNKVSQTIGTILDEQFSDTMNLRTSAFKYKNQKMIEFGKNKIQKQNYEIAQLKHLETFRVFSNLNEMQTNFGNFGIFHNDLIDNPFINPESNLRVLIQKDLNNTDFLSNQLSNITNFNSKTIVNQVENIVNDSIINYKNFDNLEKRNIFKNNENSIIQFNEDFINNLIEKNNYNNEDTNIVKQKVINSLGLNELANRYAQEITKGQNDMSFSENSKTLGLAIYDEVMKTQNEKTIKGSQLNKQFGIDTFESNKNYTIQQIQQMNDVKQINLDTYTNIKNTYEIDNNKVFINTPMIVNGQITHAKLNIGINETDFRRYLNSNFRMNGEVLVESLFNMGLNENEIVTELNKVQSLVKEYQSGNILNQKEILKNFNNLKLNDDIKMNIINTVQKGNDIAISNIVNRSQSMIKGNSQFFNHSIQGSLSAFNKLGARPWQALETLDDVILNVSTNLENGEITKKSFNITRELARQKSKQTDYVMNTDFIKNNNLRGLSKNENKFINNIEIESRDSIKGLFFDSYGIVEKNGNIKHGNLAFNESMYLNKGFSELLQGKQRRVRDFSFDSLPLELQEQLSGVKDIKKINSIFNEFTNNNQIAKRIELYNSLPDNQIAFFNKESIEKIKNFYEETGTSSYQKFQQTKAFLNKNTYINDLTILSEKVKEQMNQTDVKIYNSLNNTQAKINFFDSRKNNYTFLRNRLNMINTLNSYKDDLIDLDLIGKNNLKSLKHFQKQNRIKGLHNIHTERLNVVNIDLVKNDLLNLTYNKTNDILGLDYKDSYILNNVVFNEKTNTYSISYDDITVGALGTKVHMNDGYKGTVSSIVNKMMAGNLNIAGLNSSKGFSRQFDGGSLYSTIETSLWLGNKLGNSELEKEYFNVLNNMNYKGKKFNLFETLGLNVNKTNNGYEIFDLNSGLKSYDDYSKLSNPDAINNPQLSSKINTMSTVNKLKKIGINSFQELDMLINEQYENIFKNEKGFTKIYGEKQVTINDQVYNMIGKLSLKSLSVTGANQNSPYQNALKVDGLISRFFDARGFESVGRSLRRSINTNNTEFLSQFNYAFKKHHIDLLNGKQVKLIDNNNLMKFGLNLLSDDVDLVNDILFGEQSFNDFVYNGIEKITKETLDSLPEGIRKQVGKYVNNIQEKQNIRSIPTIIYDNKDLQILNKNISNKFNSNLNDISKKDSLLFNQLTNYYNTLKGYVANDDLENIKILNKNNKGLIDSLNKYKENNKNIIGMNSIFNNLLKNNDTGELAKIINLIENPSEALNYNFLVNGIFIDPKDDILNLNPIRSQIRNLMDLDVYNKTEGIFNEIKNKIDSGKFIDLTKEDKLIQYINEMKNKDLNKLTNIDLEILKFISPSSNKMKENPTKNIDKYLSHFASLNTPDTKLDIKKDEALKSVAKADLNLIISNFLNKKSFIIDNADSTNDVLKSLTSVENKLFRSLYGMSDFLKQNLTKKDSFLTDYFSVKSVTSFSEQAIEGSATLSFIANKVTDKLKEVNGDMNKFIASDIYKSINNLFGEEITQQVVLKNLFNESNLIKNNKFDITKIGLLNKQIQEIESITLVSQQSLARKSKDTLKSINSKLDDKRSFLGFMYRGPGQSSENIVPTLNYLIDNDIEGNMIIDELKKQNFGKSGSATMILGKGTASRMKQDNDGDKIYLTLVNDLMKSSTNSEIQETNKDVYLSVLLSNDRDYSDERYASLGFDINSKAYKKIKNYHQYYNSLNDIRMKENIDSHYHIANLLNGVDEYRGSTMKIFSYSDDKQRYKEYLNLKNNIVKKFSGLSDSQVEKQLTDYLGLEINKNQAKVINKIKNPFDFFKANEVYLKDTNVAKTGIVYTTANRARNVVDVMASMNLDEDSFDYLAKSIAKLSGNEDSYKDILTKFENSINEQGMTKKEFVDYINEIKNTNYKASMATFEAIEFGVISGKHGTKTVHEELERITKSAFKGTTNYDFKFLKNLKVNKINNDDINATKDLLKRLSNSKTAEDKDLFKILAMMLDSKMYQENDLSKILLTGDHKAKEKAINSLNKKNVQNINVALTMVGDYAENMTRINKFEQVIASGLENTGIASWYSQLRKNNPLSALGKLLGIDIGQITRNGKEEQLNELIENRINNIFTQDVEGYDNTILNPDDIIATDKKIYKKSRFKTSHKSKPKQQYQEKLREEIKENTENIINKNQEKLKEVIDEVNEQNKKFNAKEKTEKIINKTSEKLKNMSKKKWGVLIGGAVLLSTTIGYTTGRRNTTVNETMENDEKLGVGQSNINSDYIKQNDLGY